jgi:hypothetical protein
MTEDPDDEVRTAALATFSQLSREGVLQTELFLLLFVFKEFSRSIPAPYHGGSP